MFLDLSNCGPSPLLKILYFIKILLDIVLFLIPIGLIVFLSVDLGKAMISGDESTQKKVVQLAAKRILYAIVIFLVPVIVSFSNSMLGDLGVNYSVCWDNLNLEEIKHLSTIEYSCEIAEKYVSIAEYKLTDSAIIEAEQYVSEVMDEGIKTNLKNRLELAKKEAKNKPNKDKSSNSTFTNVNNYSTSGGCILGSTISVFTTEPDPSCAINYWDRRNHIDKNDFIYPTKNGKKLGAWPKNYNTIPTKLNSPKTYQSGRLIWPVTPNGNKYNFVYEHNGIDIMAPVGQPIYSPVSGNLRYSEWGHTTNKGSDETAYSVSIIMDDPLFVSNKKYNVVFLTHMSGIIERCDERTCNSRVEKGDLIGFVGNAAGTAESSGYAPHLHMTIYPSPYYADGLRTSNIQKLYNITCGSGCKNLDIRAGG